MNPSAEPGGGGGRDIDSFEKPYISTLLMICRAIGYGRVMQVVSEAWREKDPSGAISLGPCYGSLKSAAVQEIPIARPPEADPLIEHTHTWVYNAVLNAMFCRCRDRIDLDHRLPAAIEAAYALTDKAAIPSSPSAPDPEQQTINFACGCFVSFFIVDGRLQSALACCAEHEKPYQTIAGICGDTREIAFRECYVPIHIQTLKESFEDVRGNSRFINAELIEHEHRTGEWSVAFTVDLPEGRWNMSRVRVLFDVNAGYPFAHPECFWADEKLRLSHGGFPWRAGLQPHRITGQVMGWFWFPPFTWNPRRDTLLTYANMIRLALWGHYDQKDNHF